MERREAFTVRLRGARPRPTWQQWLVLLLGASIGLALFIVIGFLALLLLPVIALAVWLARRNFNRTVAEARRRQQEQARTIEGEYRSLD